MVALNFSPWTSVMAASELLTEKSYLLWLALRPKIRKNYEVFNLLWGQLKRDSIEIWRQLQSLTPLINTLTIQHLEILIFVRKRDLSWNYNLVSLVQRCETLPLKTDSLRLASSWLARSGYPFLSWLKVVSPGKHDMLYREILLVMFQLGWTKVYAACLHIDGLVM